MDGVILKVPVVGKVYAKAQGYLASLVDPQQAQQQGSSCTVM